MSVPVAAWLFFRCLRWLLWIATAAYYTEFYVHSLITRTPSGTFCPQLSFGCLRFLSQPFFQASSN